MTATRDRVLTAPERRSSVLREVMAGRGTVQGLSDQFSVSHATIRRDLQFLSQTGQTSRTYGGAVPGPGALELSLRQKEFLRQREKESIARTAVARVADGETLILDAGTTVGRLAQELRNREKLTVCTNGVSSILSLAEADDVMVIALGGHLRHISQAFIGPLAEATLQHVSADKVFLGVDGLTEYGICCPTAAHGTLKTLMTARANEVYILADYSKLNKSPYHYWAPYTRPFTLITDWRAARDELEWVSSAGGEVLIAEEDGPIKERRYEIGADTDDSGFPTRKDAE